MARRNSSSAAIGESIASRVADVIQSDGSTVKAAKKELKRIKTQTLDEAEERLEGAMDFIRDNPMKVLLLAAGAGAVAGFMIGRRR